MVGKTNSIFGNGDWAYVSDPLRLCCDSQIGAAMRGLASGWKSTLTRSALLGLHKRENSEDKGSRKHFTIQ